VKTCGVLALVLVVVLTACARVVDRGVWGTPHEMTLARTSDPSSLNPLFESSQADQDLTQLYAEPLVGLSPQNRLVPIVASRVPSVQNGDISPDGQTITYHLRRDERFSDGVRLTSKDVAFTYRAILDRRNPVSEAQPYRIIQRLDIPDAYTVVVHLRRRWAAAVAVLFAETDVIYGILPAHAFATTDVSHAAWNGRPFGSGPFRVARWDRGAQIVLMPNPYARRKPRLTKLVIKIVPDRNTELLLLRTHAVDVVDSIVTQQVNQAQTIPGVHLVRTEKNFIGFLPFNTQRAPTNDAKIRHALVEAIDQRAIAHKVFYDFWPRATTELAPALWAHDPSIPVPVYDPKAAATTLRGKGIRLILSYTTESATAREVATIVQANLAMVGVRAILRAYPPTTYFSVPDGVYYGGRFNLAWAGWYGGTDPEQSEFFTCSQRAPGGPDLTRWCDPWYDRMFLEQSATLDRQVRTATLYKMQRTIRNAGLFVPLVYSGSFSGTNPAVRGWFPNMLYEFSNSEDWDVVPNRTARR
jgi:peptide/nickel transport system substrate-binding protein